MQVESGVGKVERGTGVWGWGDGIVEYRGALGAMGSGTVANCGVGWESGEQSALALFHLHRVGWK